MINVGHPERSAKLEEVLSAGLATRYAHVRSYQVTDTNTLLVASDRPVDDALMLASAQPDLQPVAEQMAAVSEPAPVGKRDPYTDDRAPVEWLVDTSIVEYAAGG